MLCYCIALLPFNSSLNLSPDTVKVAGVDVSVTGSVLRTFKCTHGSLISCEYGACEHQRICEYVTCINNHFYVVVW